LLLLAVDGCSLFAWQLWHFPAAGDIPFGLGASRSFWVFASDWTLFRSFLLPSFAGLLLILALA